MKNNGVQRKVQVWVLDTEKKAVLLLQTIPERDSFWQPVTGSVEEGETLTEAALREVCEETGLGDETKVIDLHYKFSFQSTHR